MNKIIYISILILSVSSCQFKFEQVKLYDEFKKPADQEKMKAVVYADAEGTMWNSLLDCGEFEISNKAFYAGKSSIKLSWDKSSGCEWLGFGNSFNNWQPANMNTYINTKALTFFVRSQDGKVNGIPIVLALEDFSGGGSYLFIDCKKYLKGLSIDTTWKQVIIPLWDFPIKDEIENDEVDISSIKQIKFQLEGSGSYYIDEISLIEYSKNQYKMMISEVENMKPKGFTNQKIYHEGHLDKDGWGTGQKICHSLKEVTDTSGNTFIKWEYESNNCDWAKWGINWNNWYQINFRGIEELCNLEFKMKANTNSEFSIILEDFKGHSSTIKIPNKNTNNLSKWSKIKIPLEDFNLKENNFVLDQIKQITFKGKNSGKVFLDDIKIVQK